MRSFIAAGILGLLVLPVAAAQAADELLVTNHAGAGSRFVDLNDTTLRPGIADLRFGHWSPDGTKLIGNIGGTVVVMNADGGGRRVVGGNYFHPVFSPDGRRWAGWRVAGGAIEIAVGTTAGGTSPVPPQPIPNLPAVRMLSGAAQLAWSSQNEIAFVYLTNPQTAFDNSNAVGLIRPDGSGFRTVLDLPAPPKPLPDDSTYDQPQDLAFSPDGKTLALGRYISFGRLGGTPESPFEYGFRITTVAVQPGGLDSDRLVGIAVSPTGTLNVTGVWPRGLSYAPDGERIAVVGDADGDISRLTEYRPSTGSFASIGARSLLKVAWRPTVTDTDGDALPDTWETNGVDMDGDGTPDLDLKAMGADPKHRDLFIELDYMPPHEFEQAAVDLVVQAFANAPTPNPDGTTGIALHIDNGPNSVMNPRTGDTWGSDSEHDSITHRDLLGTGGVANYSWSEFDTLKTAHFPSTRKGVFHYAISAHGFDPVDAYTGMSRDIPGSDFILTLGDSCKRATGVDCTGSIDQQAADLMHEFGHNLGLEHGGNELTNGKPNYLSVMNYAFSLTGLRRFGGPNVMDYSRFVFPFDERSLNEQSGFGRLPTAPESAFWTVGTCPSGTAVGWALHTAVDFDCDGALTAPGTISADVNGDGVVGPLAPFDDWANLQFDGGNIGAPNVPLPGTTSVDEPTFEEQLEAAEVPAPVAPAPPPPVPPAPPPPAPPPSPPPPAPEPPAAPAPPAPPPAAPKPKPKPKPKKKVVKKVVLCHRGRTIKVPKSQVKKHRRHHDKLGRCKKRKRARG